MVTLFDCYSTTNDANTGVKEHYKFIPTEIVCSSIFANGREDTKFAVCYHNQPTHLSSHLRLF